MDCLIELALPLVLSMTGDDHVDPPDDSYVYQTLEAMVKTTCLPPAVSTAIRGSVIEEAPRSTGVDHVLANLPLKLYRARPPDSNTACRLPAASRTAAG